MSNDVSWLEGRITDEGIEVMRARLGEKRTMRAWNPVATEAAIWHFALGVGDDNPLWWEPAHAATSRWGRMFAPPTFLYSCSSGGHRLGDEAFGGVEEFLPGTLGLWANDRWHWYQPTFEGTRVEAVAELWNVEEKRSSFSGRSVAQTDRTTYFDADTGAILAECDRTIMRFERSATRQKSRDAHHTPARYSLEELAAIHAQYDAEVENRRGPRRRVFGEVEVGESLGRLVKGPLTITNMVGWLLGWGSPMCQTNRIQHRYFREHPGARLFDEQRGLEDTLEGAHWDPYFAQMSGLADGYDFGGQRISWAAHLLTDWCGDDGFVTDLHVHLRRPNYLGDTTWFTGSVTAKYRKGDRTLVDCELTGTNQRGQITTTGTATVELPDS